MDGGEHRNAPGGNGEGCESGVEGVDLPRQFAEWFLQREFPRSGVSCSRFIYFMLRRNDLKVCEFNLPAMFSIDVRKKIIYPLDDRVQAFLVKKYSTQWK